MIRYVVGLDAGHRPSRTGASANGVDEQAVNWILTDMIRKLIEGKKISPVMTRPTYFDNPTLADRVRIANKAKADLFISIHLNASLSHTARGMEVYHYRRSKSGRDLAVIMADALKCITGLHICRVIGSPSPRYDKTLAVLKNTNMPALLLEAGFITNVKGARRFKSLLFPEAFCLGVKRGIVGSLRAIGNLK